jgi:hypothetical protein
MATVTTPSEPLYPETSHLLDWSVINFSFEPDTSSPDEDESEECENDQESPKTLRELLEENDMELRQKICTKCKNNLPFSSFSKDANTPSGRRTRCKKCTQESVDQKKSNERSRKSIANNPERYRERNRINSRVFGKRHPERKAAAKRSSRVKHWENAAVSRCRLRAKYDNIPFGFTKEDISPLPEFCPVLGVRLIYDGKGDRRCWASIDRIIPSVGYLSGNVRVISLSANWAKSDGIGDLFPVRPKRNPKKTMPDQPSLFDGE